MRQKWRSYGLSDKEAYTQLETAGKTLSGRALARMSQVAKPTALECLRTPQQQAAGDEQTQGAAGTGGEHYD
jgi:hypothetical protein